MADEEPGNYQKQEVPPMAVNYEYYRIFYYVAKYRNLTQAAAALYSSQPNVTRTMKQLEHELGCQLLIRSNKGIQLTAEGEQLYAHVAVAFEQLQLGEAELHQSLSLQGGTVSIGASETALHLFLFDKLRLFLEKYPGIRIKIYNYNSPQALAALQSGQIDYAVTASPGEMPPSIRSIPLKIFRDILAGGTRFAHFAASPAPSQDPAPPVSHDPRHTCVPADPPAPCLSLRDLAGCPLVSLDKRTSTYDLYNRFYLDCGLVWEPDIEVATADLILPMLENNLGVGFLPMELAAKSLSEGRIYQIRIKETIPQRSICLMYDAGKPLGASARALGDMLLHQDPS